MAEKFLNLYTTFQFTPNYWNAPVKDQQEVRALISEQLHKVTETHNLYSVFPTRPDSDFMVWATWGADEPEAPGIALQGFQKASNNWRRFVTPTQTLWGLTKVSMYARGKSAQDIDPYDGDRTRYLVIYPFSKTKEWYLMSMDARQGQMNEHIKLGKQYQDIKQLLVYSFGLQDQEFVVAYEMEDLARFSELVNMLRQVESRRHTLLDTPIITGIHLGKEQFING